MSNVPLVTKVTNSNTDTILINHPTPSEVIHNEYELPSTMQTIQYLYAAASFPTKATWVKAIKEDNFVGWPGLTVADVNPHFPESNKAQKGHMKQWQNVRCIKKAEQYKDKEDSLSLLTKG